MKTTFNKIFNIASFAILGILCFGALPSMAAEISMSATANEATGPLSFNVTPGQTCTSAAPCSLSIFLDNDQAAMYSLQFTLTYPSVMTITSVGVGGAMAGCNTNSSTYGNCNVLANLNTPGTAVIGLYSSSPYLQQNGQQIVVISYTVNSNATAGNSSFTISGALFNETGLTVTNSPATMVVSSSSGGSVTTPWGVVLTTDTGTTPTGADLKAMISAALGSPSPNFVLANALISLKDKSNGINKVTVNDVVLLSDVLANKINQSQLPQ